MVRGEIVLAIGVNPSRALILSQVALSFGIPFALVPLVPQALALRSPQELEREIQRERFCQFLFDRQWTALRGCLPVLLGKRENDAIDPEAEPDRRRRPSAEELDEAGVRREAITVMPVPGAFELPLAAMALAKTRRYACVVALGCVVRGETPHFEFIASEAASGLQLAALETGVPVAIGVLTVDMVEQAEARVSKGAEAVRTALEMADAFAQLRASAAR